MIDEYQLIAVTQDHNKLVRDSIIRQYTMKYLLLFLQYIAESLRLLPYSSEFEKQVISSLRLLQTDKDSLFGWVLQSLPVAGVVIYNFK